MTETKIYSSIFFNEITEKNLNIFFSSRNDRKKHIFKLIDKRNIFKLIDRKNIFKLNDRKKLYHNFFCIIPVSLADDETGEADGGIVETLIRGGCRTPRRQGIRPVV